MRASVISLFSISLMIAGCERPPSVNEEYKIAKDVVIYEAIVTGTKIKIVASERRFDPAKHETTELADGDPADPAAFKPATVDGRNVVGTDLDLPKAGYPQLDRLTVYFGDKEVDVPKGMLHHVFKPHISEETSVFNPALSNTIISISRDAKCVIVDLGAGDGGGSSTTKFVISADGKVTTKGPYRPGDP